jgi:fluoride exporter
MVLPGRARRVTVWVWFAVGGFGAVGAMVRFGAERVSGPGRAHLGTLAVNLTGAFALGVIVGAGSSHRVLLIVGGGLLGATTTFSTWMLESHRLGRDGRTAHAVANLAGSLVAGFAMAVLGWWLGRFVA